MQNLFRVLDENHNGNLNFDELQLYIKMLKEQGGFDFQADHIMIYAQKDCNFIHYI